MEVKFAISEDDINTCFKLREIVFIEEQNVPVDREQDEDDKIAVHFLLLENNIPIGTGRVVKNDEYAKIERVCILKEYRKKGAGKFLMEEIMNYCKKQNCRKISLGAQEHALNFYKKLGFKIFSGKYMDANIPHFKMQLEI